MGPLTASRSSLVVDHNLCQCRIRLWSSSMSLASVWTGGASWTCDPPASHIDASQAAHEGEQVARAAAATAAPRGGFHRSPSPLRLVSLTHRNTKVHDSVACNRNLGTRCNLAVQTRHSWTTVAV